MLILAGFFLEAVAGGHLYGMAARAGRHTEKRRLERAAKVFD